MKQFNYEFTEVYEVNDALGEISAYTADNPYKSILFHMYTIEFSDVQIKQVQDEILYSFPDAQIAGTSSNGDICDGHLADNGLVMAVSVFDTTDAKSYLFECGEKEECSLGEKIREVIDDTAYIKAAEILITLKSINSHVILSEAEKCRKDVKIFGGGSAGKKIEDVETYVFTGDGISHAGVYLVTYAGRELNVDIHHAIGWKPLGKDLTATKIEGKKLYELDDKPAAEIYSKYLDIQPNDNFFMNILEFPIMAWQHGQSVLRLPFSCDSTDGSITLAAGLDKGTTVNLSYGDPEVIKEDVTELLGIVKDFAPQSIFLYSCGVRKLYWKYLINKETGPFSKLAPVSGFYSSGEIMRMDQYLIEHHVTIIAVSMREGEKAEAQPTGHGDKKIDMPDEQKIHGQISMVRRLATFINVTSAELREANEELQIMADTDVLTGLNNRRMIDKLVRTAFQHSTTFKVGIILGIIDVDDFKAVNDTYGHAIGDKVLVTISRILKEEIEKCPSAMVGRWGGEEFLFIIPNMTIYDALSKLNSIRKLVEETDFGDAGQKTISIGITEHIPGDKDEDVFKRADDALYEAKESGKNRICVK